MRIPLPSEISQSLYVKFNAMEDKLQEKFIGERGASGPNIEKKAFTVGAVSMASMVIISALGSKGGSLAAGMLLTRVGPDMALACLGTAAITLIGSFVLGAVYKHNNKTEQNEIKAEVLKQQYGKTDKEDIKHYAELDNYDFHRKFKNAVYNESVKSAIETHKQESKLTTQISSSISSLRDKFLGRKKDDNKKITV